MVKPHWLSQIILLLKFLAGAGIVLFIALIAGEQSLAQRYLGQIGVAGGILAGFIVAIGLWVIENVRRKNIAYMFDYDTLLGV